MDKWSLTRLRQNYPDVLPVSSDAEFLPFPDNSFNSVEFILPSNRLMTPGLQNDHFSLLRQFKTEYAKKYPNGWYQGFHRILKPNGKLIIFGDIWIDPSEVLNTSKSFFNVELVKQLTIKEFEDIGTPTVPQVVRNIRNNPHIPQINTESSKTLYQIILQRKK